MRFLFKKIKMAKCFILKPLAASFTKIGPALSFALAWALIPLKSPRSRALPHSYKI
jgi:hypothetical protein